MLREIVEGQLTVRRAVSPGWHTVVGPWLVLELSQTPQKPRPFLHIKQVCVRTVDIVDDKVLLARPATCGLAPPTSSGRFAIPPTQASAVDP